MLQSKVSHLTVVILVYQCPDSIHMTDLPYNKFVNY